MLKKISLTILSVFIILIVFVSCNNIPTGCEHDWLEAGCETAKICSICKTIEGEPLICQI